VTTSSIKEAQMRIAAQLLAVVAAGLLSTDVALARHQHHYRANADTNSFSQKPVEPVKSGISPDVARDAVVDRDHGPHDIKDHDSRDQTDHGPRDMTDRGPHDVRVPDTAPSDKDGHPDTTAIDTSITVNQGHRTGRDGNGPSVKTADRKYKKAIVKHEPDHHHDAATAFKPHWQRNAVGALVKRDDPVVRRDAVGVLLHEHDKHDREAKSVAGQTTPPPGQAAAPLSGPASAGNATVARSVTDPTAKNDHRLDPAVLQIVRTNGQSIDGTGLRRPAYNLGALGGAVQVHAQLNSGVLSGNMFHPKHP
jgi:hypothetical protein